MGKKFWIPFFIVILIALGGFFFWHRKAVEEDRGHVDLTDLSSVYDAQEETDEAIEKFKKDPAAHKAKVIHPLTDTGKNVYLYFDGLPDRAMAEEILSVLDKKKAKAAFFAEGQNGADSPETLKAIVKKGQVIGNYTWLGRPEFQKLEPEKAIRSMVRTQKALGLYMQKKPDFFRAPRTEYTDTLLEEAGASGLSYVVLSNLTVRRGQLKSSSDAAELVKDIKPGSLIAFEINPPLDLKRPEVGKWDERPAIDKKPTIRDDHFRTDVKKKDRTAEEVGWLIDALEEEGFDLESLYGKALLSALKD